MDELIKKYAERMQKMYDDRTAGDHSMSGILSEMLEEISDSCYAVSTLNRRHERLCPSSPHKNVVGLTSDDAVESLRRQLAAGRKITPGGLRN